MTIDDSKILKGIAICAMLWHHLFYEHPEYGKIVFHLALLGKVCVSMFLMISGYGLTKQYNKVVNPVVAIEKRGGGGKFSFILRRLIKFYSNYWIVFCIFVPLGVFVFDRGLSIPYGESRFIFKPLLLDIFGLQHFSSYNITWWFNRLIIIMWITFPLFHKLITSYTESILLLPVVIILFPSDVLAFILGIYLATYQHGINEIIDRFGQFRVMAVLSILLLVLCINRNIGFIECLAGTKADPYISLIVVILVPMVIKKIIKRAVFFPFLGEHSINIYLVHTFIYYYFFSDFIYSFKYPALIFLVLLILTLCISIALEELKKRTGYVNLVRKLLDCFSN